VVRPIEGKKPFNFVAQSFTPMGLMAYNLLFPARDDFLDWVHTRFATFTC
jgi:hypothetical protein